MGTTLWPHSTSRHLTSCEFPLDLTVTTCKQALKAGSGLSDHTIIDTPDFGELLRFWLSNTYFSRNTFFHQQVRVTAMEASLSVTTANVVMEALEGKVQVTFTLALSVLQVHRWLLLYFEGAKHLAIFGLPGCPECKLSIYHCTQRQHVFFWT